MGNYRKQLPETEKVARNLFLLIKGERVEIQPKDIIYLEADINYTTFHTLKNRFTTSFPLKFFGTVLEEYPYFLRINKSYIVNINYLQGLNWEKGNKEARLTGGICLPISRRKAGTLGTLLWNKIKAN